MLRKKTSQKPTKVEVIKPGHPDYLQPATKEVFTLMDKGLCAEDATKLIKNKDKLSPNAKTKINKKYAQYSLQKPAIVKLAHNAIKDTLNMTEVVDSSGNVSIPSHTNRLAAANMVMERSQPVIKQNLNLNVNADVSPVDLSEYIAR